MMGKKLYAQFADESLGGGEIFDLSQDVTGRIWEQIFWQAYNDDPKIPRQLP